MKVVDGWGEEMVNPVSDATSELSELSIVLGGRHIRGCNMMVMMDMY